MESIRRENMAVYEAYYRDMLIGQRYNSEGRHRYVSNAENAERVRFSKQSFKNVAFFEEE